MTSSRRTAAIVGLLFLIATVSFIAADALIKGVLDRPNYLIGASGDATALSARALLAFVDGLAVVGLAVLMFPLLKHTSEPLALGYFGLRVAELGVVLLYMVAPLSVLALSNGTRHGAGDVSASQSLGSLLKAQHDLTLVLLYLFTSVSGIIFAFLLYRSTMVPRPLAVLGLIGYPALLAGAVLAMFGVTDVTQGAGFARRRPGRPLRAGSPDLAPRHGIQTSGRDGVKSSSPRLTARPLKRPPPRDSGVDDSRSSRLRNDVTFMLRWYHGSTPQENG